jgi:hypothetical protein
VARLTGLAEVHPIPRPTNYRNGQVTVAVTAVVVVLDAPGHSRTLERMFDLDKIEN